jgi:hypothetical protein
MAANPQVGSMQDRKTEKAMNSADGFAVAKPSGRSAEFARGRNA